MTAVVALGAGIATLAVLQSLQTQPEKQGEHPWGPWTLWQDDAASTTTTHQPVVRYEQDIDDQYQTPIVWEIFANGTRRKLFLHNGETIPTPPTYE